MKNNFIFPGILFNGLDEQGKISKLVKLISAKTEIKKDDELIYEFTPFIVKATLIPAIQPADKNSQN